MPVIGPQFASCLLKIGRAEEHLSAFQGDLRNWLNQGPYSVRKEYNSDTGRHSLVVHISGTAPFDRLALIAGDCAHNLRCALDHLAYALAVMHTGSDPPPDANKIQFPICDSLLAFDKQRYRIASLSKTSQVFIESVQPYHKLHTELPPILGVLNVFENFDKHKLIHLTFDVNVGGKISFSKQLNWVMPAIHWIHEPLESGKEFLYFTTAPFQAELDYKYEATFAIGVSHTPGPTGRDKSPIESVLIGMVAETKRIINAAI